MPNAASKIAFRSDINGLRAWAVVAVLLFHFDIGGFTGGFAGVDIFFVISGFLMTSIIVKGLENGNFSLLEFYLARARRIIPALLALVSALLALGWFLLPTSDYRTLGSQAVYTLAFISNISFWRSSGYFDTESQEKWLLHTWSLAVEWQFYILFPIYLAALWKLLPDVRSARGGIVCLFVCSLALSVFATPWMPVAAFYLLPARAWEMAAGGMVFLLTRHTPVSETAAKIAQGLGWPLLVLPLFLFSDALRWPGAWAALPVLGTALIMMARNERNPLTASAAAQWLGNRSYSLYLWHWPLVVALNFAGLSDSWPWMAAAIGLSLALGHISYHLVENPMRIYFGGKRGHRTREILVMGAVVAVVGLMAAGVRLLDFEGRIPAAVEIASAEALNNSPTRDRCFAAASASGSPGCVYGDGDALGVILIGDSHALSVAGALGETAAQYGRNALFWGMSACDPLQGLMYSSNNPIVSKSECRDFNDWAFKQLGEHPGDIPVLLVGRFAFINIAPGDASSAAGPPSVYFTREPRSRNDPGFQREFQEVLIDTACRLAESRPVYLMRPIPEMDVHVPRTIARNLMFGLKTEDFTISRDEYRRRRSLVWEAQDEAAARCGVSILDPLPYLCDEERCYGSRNGRPLYYDDDHLSEYGNRYLMPMFAGIFE